MIRNKLFSLIAFLILLFSTENLLSQAYSIELKQTTKSFSIEPNLYKNRIVPFFMIAVGVGMIGIWTADIVSGKFSDQGGFFSWREGDNMLWPHITAELLTSFGLTMGGIGLYGGKDWGLSLSLISLGALAYSSINSSGWVFAEKNRLSYGIPMWISLTGATISFVILIN